MKKQISGCHSQFGIFNPTPTNPVTNPFPPPSVSFGKTTLPKKMYLDTSKTNSFSPWKLVTLGRWFISSWGKFGPIFRGELLLLVAAFNPFEKYARQIGSFPHSSGWKISKKCLKPPPRAVSFREGLNPTGSMCGILTHIWLIFMVTSASNNQPIFFKYQTINNPGF